MDCFSIFLSFPHIVLYLYLSSFILSPPVSAVLMTNTTTSDDPRLALLSFKSLLSDPLDSLASWGNKSLHYCRWRGVTCSDGDVVAIDLDSLGLAGTISPSISNLTSLRRLHLPDNSLTGNIPDELGRLSQLRSLNLTLNSLQGEIPAALSRCSNLQVISLSSNDLSGKIPSNLTRCFRLQYISIRGNMLGGEIPAGIGSLPALETLDLSENNLVGSIPPLLGSSPSLIHVGLWNNSLTGSISPFLANSSTIQDILLYSNYLTGQIPPSLGNITSLVNLDLSLNRLTGSIPPFLSNPSPLLYLVLFRNQLTGEIPHSLGNLTSLGFLLLSENGLDGSIPESLGQIPNLQQLELSVNGLSGEVPSSLYNLSSIRYLGLGMNQLSGKIPQDIGLTSLPYLTNLVLATNRFGGPIPPSITNASGLQVLLLGDNSFAGVVPNNLGSLQNLRTLGLHANQLEAGDWSFLSSLTNCSLLESLFLYNNKLEGALQTTSIGNLSTGLLKLQIANNRISGTIPEEIGNLVGLTLLSLGGNLLGGSIPTTIGKLVNMVVLVLSENKILGSIPSSIGNLTQLSYLYLGKNQLSGAVPTTIVNCKSLTFLNLSLNFFGGSIPVELLSIYSLSQSLDLSYNSFNGSIPAAVGRLINIGGLDVSHNQLSGDIPSALGNCVLLGQIFMQANFFQRSIPQSFKNLKGLKDLDLSNNNLSGEIPDFFGTIKSLRFLNLSFNDFEGEVPNKGVFNNASEIYILGNSKLCGGNPKLQLVQCSTNSHKRRTSHLKIVIPIVIGTVIILLLSLFGILYKRRETRGPPPASSFNGDTYIKISYADIHKATDGFSPVNLVGAGSFGSVYKGMIDSEKNYVAVKVLNLHRKGASKSFIAECEALRSIRHKNLVKIITACSSIDHKGDDFKALVFEYMSNGSLDQWLHSEVGLKEDHKPRKLTLIQRLNIAIDIVSALDYLHHSCEPPVVHCDLKPSNVLLDDDMMAHVGDFGLARLLSKSIPEKSMTSINSMNGIKGTIGYVAPEYGMGAGVSTKADVYSFGVMLLEMMTGKRPTDEMFKDGLSLRKHVETASLTQDMMNVADPQLVLGYEDITAENRARVTRCILSLIRIGFLCSNDAPGERMEMRDVAAEIHTIKQQFLG